MNHVLSNSRRWLLGLSLSLCGLVSQVLGATASATNPSGVSITSTTARSGDNLVITSTSSGLAGGTTGTNVYTMVYINNSGISDDYDHFVGWTTSGTRDNTYSCPQASGPWYIQVFVQNENNGSVLTKSSVVLIDSPLGLVQTISLSPSGGAAALANGQQFIGTATGAQAGNAYNISIVSGPGSAAIASNGAYVISTTGTGLVTYKVWASAGGGYDRSDDAVASIAVTASKTARFSIPANTGSFTIKHEIKQDGVVLKTIIKAPGSAGEVVTVTASAAGGDILMYTTIQGVGTNDSGSYVTDPLKEVTFVDPTPVVTSPDPTVPPPVTSTTDASVKDPTTPKKPKILWSSAATTPNTDPTNQTDLLTNKTYREGVEGLAEVITEWSGAEDFTKRVKEVVDANDNRADDEAAAEWASKGATKASETTGSFNEVGASIGVSSEPPTAAPALNFAGQFGAQFTAAWSTAVNGLDPAALWIKTVLRWAIAFLYTMFVYKELNEKLMLSMIIPQAKGNPVSVTSAGKTRFKTIIGAMVGGMGTRMASLTAAAVISGIILTLPVLLWSAYVTPWNDAAGFAAGLSMPAVPFMSSNASVQTAMAFLGWCIPLDMLFIIPPLVLTVKKAGWIIILSVATLIRHVTP